MPSRTKTTARRRDMPMPTLQGTVRKRAAEQHRLKNAKITESMVKERAMLATSDAVVLSNVLVVLLAVQDTNPHPELGVQVASLLRRTRDKASNRTERLRAVEKEVDEIEKIIETLSAHIVAQSETALPDELSCLPPAPPNSPCDTPAEESQ
jgi:hypothetical protein